MLPVAALTPRICLVPTGQRQESGLAVQSFGTVEVAALSQLLPPFHWPVDCAATSGLLALVDRAIAVDVEQRGRGHRTGQGIQQEAEARRLKPVQGSPTTQPPEARSSRTAPG